MLNLNHFYYFYMVAQTGSVTAASGVLRISQPALSKQINIFEGSINTKLFERQGRGLRLTPAGLSLYGQARGVFEKAEQISRDFSVNIRAPQERIQLGFGMGVGRPLASDLIGRFFNLYADRAARPCLTAYSLEGDSLSKYLQEHVIDACLTERRLANPALMAVASISAPMCLAVPAPFSAKLKGVKKDELSAIVAALKLPWILPTPNIRLRYDIENIAERHGFELESILESDSMISIVRSVESGLGVSLIPKYYVKAARQVKRILLIENLKSLPKVSLYMWARRAEIDRPILKNLTQAFNLVFQ
ncbi:MAG: LysR family transcriptional regulator [Oligoflexia bacterium]|nr:LysR family transcriptional regulator [Oligoflexia bacterium]